MFTGAVTGPLFDAGYFRALITVGTFMVPLGLFMTSISSKFWHFILAQGFCVGFGAGTLFVPAIAILPQYFIEKRGLAIGIVSAGSSVGAVLYPIIFERLQENIGFRWSARSLGFIAFGTCCISQSIMRVRFTPSDRRRLVQFSAFKEPKYLVFCFALFMGYLSFYNFFFYVQSYATDTGIVGHELGLYLLSMLNAGSAFGRVIPNLIADHIGPLNVIAPVSTITTLMAFAWIGTHNAPGIIVLGILYGCASGGFMALPPLVLSALAEDDRHVGTRLGMSFAVASIGALIGTPIGGAIINDTKTYLGVQLFTACCLTTASVAFIALRFAQTGPRILTRV
jgi:predicted MFS family arabinose efflux permease